MYGTCQESWHLNFSWRVGRVWHVPSRVEVAATIRSRRKALGWRQEDLADRVGVTRKTVINWEKGQEPTENRDVLARVLGVDEGELEVTVELAPSAADRLAAELTIAKGKEVSHVLHLLLTLVTFGFWLIAWLGLGILAGVKRRMVTVDEFGNVVQQKL